MRSSLRDEMTAMSARFILGLEQTIICSPYGKPYGNIMHTHDDYTMLPCVVWETSSKRRRLTHMVKGDQHLVSEVPSVLYTWGMRANSVGKSYSEVDLAYVAELADALSRFNVRSNNRRKNHVAMIQEYLSSNDWLIQCLVVSWDMPAEAGYNTACT